MVAYFQRSNVRVRADHHLLILIHFTLSSTVSRGKFKVIFARCWLQHIQKTQGKMKTKNYLSFWHLTGLRNARSRSNSRVRGGDPWWAAHNCPGKNVPKERLFRLSIFSNCILFMAFILLSGAQWTESCSVRKRKKKYIKNTIIVYSSYSSSGNSPKRTRPYFATVCLVLLWLLCASAWLAR